MKKRHIGSERRSGGSPVKEEAIILSTIYSNICMEYTNGVLNMNIYVTFKQEKKDYRVLSPNDVNI